MTWTGSFVREEVRGAPPYFLSYYTPIIQLGESIPYKDEVVGSSPAWRANFINLVVVANEGSKWKKLRMELKGLW